MSKYFDSLENNVGNKLIFEWIDTFSGMTDFVKEMSPNRYCAWNSQPCLSFGSVEFRRPPQVMNSTEAKRWISIALCFTWHSILNERDLLGRFPLEKATSDHLRQDLFASVSKLWLKLGPMEDLCEESSSSYNIP